MLFLTALNSGLRQGELFALTWNDINFGKEYITVNKTAKTVSNVLRGGRGESEIILQTPKTNKGIRLVPIPSFLVNKLRIHYAIQQENKHRLGNLYEDNNLVFCTEYGTYLDSSNVLKRFKKILRDNNLRVIKFHDLRHTFATRLFELGENPKTVQQILGHSNISITLDIYTHVLEELKEKGVSKIDDLYKSWGTELVLIYYLLFP